MSEEARKLNERWQELPPRERRRVKSLLLVLGLGVLLLCWAKTWPAGQKEQEPSPAAPSGAVTAAASEDRLQLELESILRRVKGAGSVQVAVWYSAGASAVYATESEDSSDRHSSDGEDQLRSDSRITVAAVGDQPVLVRQEAATVQGVLVVAEGAGDPQVRERLYGAVKSLLGLKTSQIAVIEGEGSDAL